MNENLYAVLAAGFPADPRAPCLILPDGRRYGYADIERASARYANLLVEAGTKQGDRIAVQVEKSPEALFVYLGCVRAGRVFLPMNPAYQPREVEYFLRDAEPSLFVCRPASLAAARALASAAGVARVHDLGMHGEGSLAEAAVGMSDHFETVECVGGDLAAILYTSGTTGRSKGAMLSHRNLASNARVLHRHWGFRAGDVLLHMLPTFHVHGLFIATHCAMLNGSPMLFEPRFDADRALELLPHATVFMGVPTYYTRLLAEAGLDRRVCATMRLFISGSAPLLPDTFREFRARTGHTILERYGMTETGMLTSNPYEGERREGTVGPALPATELRVVGEDGAPLPRGELGCIEVRGENIFQGYWRMPEKTREEFAADGFFRTGDMGCIDADGYVTIAGRSKDLIITGGLNVYPKEIEALIDAIPGVRESAVIGLPHPDFGEAVTAVVVRSRDGAEASAESILAGLKANLASFKLPKAVIFAEELPRNTMGKVQKNVLRSRYGGDARA
ncbi:MAG: malonyl-CoA synthase [Betaproteobacteria bacterium CG2_30_68_42]|nr:MAG: malonyl-CoA synthase [Betaproteobacteria bacterium CG2_30_68_42]PIX75196.1 MAG: malonyl-CoA synthase [Rhodocyclales bacterium CG_4_10_14_3_um_filter_68_10]PJA56475.1 MAG: malonyl-CoA synthase [Rhodocyclales bacterium CG_4_9_14_3_um_filter_68_10]